MAETSLRVDTVETREHVKVPCLPACLSACLPFLPPALPGSGPVGRSVGHGPLRESKEKTTADGEERATDRTGGPLSRAGR